MERGTPKSEWSSPMWNGYVVSGKTREERRARLDEVPAKWQEGVKKHVEAYFWVKNNARANRR